MKRYLINIQVAFLFIFALNTEFSSAQNANIHFTFPEETTNRPPFEVWINDALQSGKNAKEVIITGIPTPVCRLQIVLSNNGQIQKLLQNVYLQTNTFYTYHIAKNRNGDYGIFYKKESPITSNQHAEAIIPYTFDTEASTASAPASPRPSGHLSYFVVPDLSPTPLCTTPLKNTEITQLKSSLGKEEFENRKLQAAKKLISGKCLQFTQLKELMSLFEFEKSKLDLAKFGYHYVQDIGNHAVVKETFEFEESHSNWQEYIDFLKEYR